MKAIAIIPGAGAGIRMGGRTPKQFRPLNGIPLLVRTLRPFEKSPHIETIVLVVPPGSLTKTRLLCEKHGISKAEWFVEGGATRQESVANALRALEPLRRRIVLVHDAVRPFVRTTEISAVIRACAKNKAAVPAVVPKETVRQQGNRGLYGNTIDRESVLLVQTPQAFREDILRKAFQSAKECGFQATDEAGLVERIGIRARIVKGSYDNIKVTTPEDFELARIILRRFAKKS